MFNRPAPIDPDGALPAEIGVAERIRVAPDERMIAFDFSAIDLRGTAVSGYRYRLQGFEDTWIETGVDDAGATFTALSPGDSVFEAVTVDDDGRLGAAVARLPVEVVPRLHETLAFRVAIAIAFLAAVAAAVRARQRHLEARNRALEDTVAERTAELTDTVSQLSASMQQVRRLEGILPICSGCKRIREEGADPALDESWIDVDRYLRQRTDADFSHGACPRCFRSLYGDV